MEREKFLKSFKDCLIAAGFSVDDFVQYCAAAEKSQKAEEKFAFEVMYEGLVRSWVPLEGKKPLGVIFDNHLITLRDSEETMIWAETKAYCSGINVGKYVCSAGDIDFWKQVANCGAGEKEKLDALLVCLGGEPLGDKQRWSASEYDEYLVWIFCVNNFIKWGSEASRYLKACVRPVLDLTGLSF